MTTEGEIIEYVRDINVLLEMDSYQDMSDAEIQSIIDYKVEQAKIEGALDERNSEDSAGRAQIRAARLENVQRANAVLESRLNIEIPWVTVGSDS